MLLLYVVGIVRAAEPSEWSNPYASDAARSLLAEAQARDPGITAEDVYREIQITDETTVNAEGVETNGSTVEWREVATDDESVPEEPATPTTPFITDELSDLLATEDDDAIVDVWISLRRSLYDIGGTYSSHLAVAALVRRISKMRRVKLSGLRAAAFVTALFILGCTGDGAEPAVGTLAVSEFDCEASCWRDSSIEVPREFWSTWLDSGSCDDGSVVLNYNGTCFRTSNLCQAPEGQPGWSDDPAIGDVADCCGGLTAEEQELLDPAPMCSG